jgi:hypothetical protein
MRSIVVEPDFPWSFDQWVVRLPPLGGIASVVTQAPSGTQYVQVSTPFAQVDEVTSFPPLFGFKVAATVYSPFSQTIR